MTGSGGWGNDRNCSLNVCIRDGSFVNTIFTAEISLFTPQSSIRIFLEKAMYRMRETNYVNQVTIENFEGFYSFDHVWCIGAATEI